MEAKGYLAKKARKYREDNTILSQHLYSSACSTQGYDKVDMSTRMSFFMWVGGWGGGIIFIEMEPFRPFQRGAVVSLKVSLKEQLISEHSQYKFGTLK